MIKSLFKSTLLAILLLIFLWMSAALAGTADFSRPSALSSEDMTKLESIRQQLLDYMNEFEMRFTGSKELRRYKIVKNHMDWLLTLVNQVMSGDTSPAYAQMALYQQMRGGRYLFPTEYVTSHERPCNLTRWCREVFKQVTTLETQVLQQPVLGARDVAIPAGEVSSIKIKIESGMRVRFNKVYTLSNAGSYFQVSNGRKIPVQQITALQQSLSGLQMWKHEVSCSDASDSHFRLEMELEYTDSDETLRITNESTCFGSMPVNVIWRGNVYMYFTGPLKENIFNLLVDIEETDHLEERKRNNKDVELAGDFEYRIPLVPTRGKPVISRDHTMEEALLQTLHGSAVFRPYLADRSVVDVWGHCILKRSNAGCEALNLMVKLLERDQRTVQVVPVLVNQNKVIVVTGSPRQVTESGY